MIDLGVWTAKNGMVMGISTAVWMEHGFSVGLNERNDNDTACMNIA